MAEDAKDGVREAVKERYATAARRVVLKQVGGCCGGTQAGDADSRRIV